MIRNHLRLGFCLVALSLAINGQTSTKTSSTASSGLSATERELRDFYDNYRDDLVKQRREEIADRYDARGYFGLGNGRKELVTFEENKRRYLKEWTGPKAFEWRDLSYEILSPTAATVVGVGEVDCGVRSKDRPVVHGIAHQTGGPVADPRRG